jgi:hypothetical protein
MLGSFYLTYYFSQAFSNLYIKKNIGAQHSSKQAKLGGVLHFLRLFINKLLSF